MGHKEKNGLFSDSISQPRLSLLLERCTWYSSLFPTIIHQAHHFQCESATKRISNDGSWFVFVGYYFCPRIHSQIASYEGERRSCHTTRSRANTARGEDWEGKRR